MAAVAPVRVLLLDDDSARAARIDRELTGCPSRRFEVVPCRGLAPALAILDSEGIDIALVSAELGDSLAEPPLPRLRQVAPGLPVVMLVTLAEAAAIGPLLEQGAEDYLLCDAVPSGVAGRVIDHVLTRLRLLREQEARLGELRAAIESKNRALGVLAHDLRSPINIVLGYLEMLELSRPEGFDSCDAGYVAYIKQAVGFAQALIEDVLSQAVQEANAITLTPRWVDYGSLIDRVARAHALLARSKAVEVTVDPLRSEPLIGWADPLKLEQALANLIANAVKFSHPGGMVRISAQQDEQEIALGVADEGDGIAPEIGAQLFQPFCRGASGTAGEPTTGLGLYICARIAEAHGGSIQADSHPGQGTTVTIRLPRTCAASAPGLDWRNSRKRSAKGATP